RAALITTQRSGEPSRAPEYASRAILKLKVFRAYPVTRIVRAGGCDYDSQRLSSMLLNPAHLISCGKCLMIAASEVAV
ncbi:hypothetical protein LOC67_24835, partial [Stieleria sp. JC731]|uniref:hypothetical protein n=1 Tax=Stieleria sp. JC731 TaxID=2894195 RepID=UPI001E3F2BA7